MKDYYKILQIERSADRIAIKKAFRRLSLQFHPDINPSVDAPQKFIELSEAYQVLNDHSKKSQYDQLYDYHILNKRSISQPYYQTHQDKWKSNVDDAAMRGQAKGEKYASKTWNQFRRRIDFWDAWIILEILSQLLWWI